jgi:hypothetical protein
METQQQTDSQQAVTWGPDRRTGKVLDTIPAAGQEWKVTRSDGWHERTDLPFRAYQRAKGVNTKPCDLIILASDLAPAEPVAQKPAPQSAGLKEDLSHALQAVRDMLQVGPSADVLKMVERDLMGALAQVEQS